MEALEIKKGKVNGNLSFLVVLNNALTKDLKNVILDFSKGAFLHSQYIVCPSEKERLFLEIKEGMKNFLSNRECDLDYVHEVGGIKKQTLVTKIEDCKNVSELALLYSDFKTQFV